MTHAPSTLGASRVKRVLLTLLASLALALGLGATVTPAQAVSYGSIKICNSVDGWTSIDVHNTDGTILAWLLNGECTGYLYPVGVRVDTDPLGPAHSYKIKPVGTGASGSYGPCHTNSDNHDSDPPQSDQGFSWTVYYKNYNQGNCTD